MSLYSVWSVFCSYCSLMSRFAVLLIALLYSLQVYAVQTIYIAADEFSVKSYGEQNGNGLLNWKTNWIESGDDGSPTGGDFKIEGGKLELFSDCCVWHNPNDSIEREIDLSAFSSIELRVSASIILGLSNVSLQISSNGGSSWTELHLFKGSVFGTKNFTFDISAYASSNTRIRFLNNKGGGDGDSLQVETVMIVADTGTPITGPVQCDDIFSDGVGNGSGLSVHSQWGRIRFLDKAQLLNNPTQWLSAPWVHHIGYGDTVRSCVSTYCGANGRVAPPLYFPPFPTWSGSANWNSSSEPQIGLNTNYYNDISVPLNATARVSDSNYNTFYIRKLRMEPGAKLILAPGDYYIETFMDGGLMKVINANVDFIIPTGKVRMFIRDNVSMYSLTKFNVLSDGQTMGDPEKLFMYFYTSGRVGMNDDARISGYVYTNGEFAIENSTPTDFEPALIGAVSAAEIFLGPHVKVRYDETGIEGVNFGSACISPAADHYNISHAGTGVTCQTVPVTISAYKADNSSYSKGGQTISLSTSTGNGSWVLLSGTGSLSDSTADDGLASYTFGSGESSVQLGLKNTHAETLNINVSDGVATESNSADPNLTMQSAGLVFLVDGAVGSIDTQIAGKSTHIDVPQGSHARSVNLGLRVISTDPNTGACSARLPVGNHTVQWGFECNEPATCQMASPGEVNGTSIVGNNNASAITYTSLSSAFDNNATTSFNLNYLDAGRVTLHAKVSVAATATEPAMTLTKNTNAFVVRPFGIGFTDIRSNSGNVNQGALPNNSSTLSGQQFASAGEGFDFSLGGYRYNPLHDAAAAADRNGYPSASANITSNALTANFTGSATVAVSDVLPASGNSGSLGNASALTLTAGGVTRYQDQSWSEVGTLTLFSRVSDYLGSGVTVSGKSPRIGRFYPAGFVLGAARSVTPRAYMGQPFELAYQLKAVNGSGGVTANYDDALGYSTSLVKYSAENNNDGNDIVSRLSFEPGGWKAGMYGVLSAGIVTSPYQSNSLVYDKPAVSSVTLQPNSKASPLDDLKVGISVVGAIHGVQGVADMNATTTGDCVALSNCDAHSLGSVNLHYGRLVAIPAQGTEDASKPLEVRFEMQYWDGVRFVRDRNDSTTPFYQLAGGGIYSGAPTFESYKGDLSPGEISITAPVLSRFSNGITPVGDGFKFTNVPGIGNRGSVNVRFSTADIADWAEYDRDGDADTNNDGVINALDTPNDSGDDLIVPISFAPKRGHDNIILWKENP